MFSLPNETASDESSNASKLIVDGNGKIVFVVSSVSVDSVGCSLLSMLGFVSTISDSVAFGFVSTFFAPHPTKLRMQTVDSVNAIIFLIKFPPFEILVS
jgi:hypothetical protein